MLQASNDPMKIVIVTQYFPPDPVRWIPDDIATELSQRAHDVKVVTSFPLEQQPESSKSGLTFHPPFGFNDYVKLQLEAKLVLSDSGTIAEESSMLGFPAITLRDAIERPEAIDGGAIITAGVEKESVLDAIDYALRSYTHISVPAEYLITNTSVRVVNFIRSTAATHHVRTAIRM